mmetsp:Transcript_163360/g.301771  ORF Transcript_163360/g.301771 Transcript_163360/m.301771 type:complete len:383 (-) Transcript_163360:26-1174(-)
MIFYFCWLAFMLMTTREAQAWTCSSYPTSCRTCSDQERCDNGNTLENGFEYLYNEGSTADTPGACGIAGCMCCSREKAVTIAQDGGSNGGNATNTTTMVVMPTKEATTTTETRTTTETTRTPVASTTTETTTTIMSTTVPTMTTTTIMSTIVTTTTRPGFKMYRGACDDDLMAGWDYRLNDTLKNDPLGPRDVFYSIYRSRDCAGTDVNGWPARSFPTDYFTIQTPTSGYPPGLACTAVNGGDATICLRCMNGAMKIAEWEKGSGPTYGSWGWTLHKWDETTAVALVDLNCSDGCGTVCYNLGSFSTRIAWHSGQDPICRFNEFDSEVEQACVAGMLHASTSSKTTTTSDALVSSSWRDHPVKSVGRVVVGLLLLLGASKIS